MKIPYLSLFILFLFCGVSVFAQKLKKSSGEYQLNLTDSDYSEQEACQVCKEMAMIEAIEKAFGRVVIQGNSTSIKNTNTGEEVESSQIFNMIAETYVNGEWIRTINESCSRFTDQGKFWVKCEVKGQVQELQKPKIDLQVKALDCENARCETTEFQDSESFYLYLKSPVDGYVTIYLSDPGTAQRLLPYSNMPKGQLNAVPIEADEEYIFFSQAKDGLNLRGFVDEYELFAASEVDHNRIFVIFSSEPLVKPSLYRDDTSSKYEVPMQLETRAFQRWLAEQRQFNQSMQIARLDITIRQ
ncbi:MAG: hypothetical protein AAF587_32180 [Bacteroidota bacterium]